MRHQDAKRAGQLVLSGGGKGITGKDLGELDKMYNHSNTYKNGGDHGHSERNDDLRSIKSEYDYGAKRKFVDVLGNIKTGPGADTLKGLE